MTAPSWRLSFLVPFAAVAWHVLEQWWQLWVVTEICFGHGWQECSLLARRLLRGAPLGLDAEPPAGPSLSASLARLPPAERLASVLPVAGVHVQKCGGTFGNALVRLPGVCPGLAQDELLCSTDNPACSVTMLLEQHGFPDSHDLTRLCSGMSRSWGTHEGLHSEYESLKGRLMTVLREPGQQLVSGYYDGWCSWPYPWPPKSQRHYAEGVQGFSVKLLTRDGKARPDTNLVYDGRKPTPAETRLAVRRLREGFAFVGLTEEYALTICLFHKMFGGECDNSEVRVFHAGRMHTGRGYSVDPLGGFRDIYGGAVYDEAVRIFGENLRLYNVSWETCEPCFQQARLA